MYIPDENSTRCSKRGGMSNPRNIGQQALIAANKKKKGGTERIEKEENKKAANKQRGWPP